MTNATKIWAFIIAVVLIVIALEIFLHHHGSSANNNQAQQVDQHAVTAANDCVLLCQTVYDESGGSTTGNQEQVCESTCYKSAGLPVPGSGNASSNN